MKCFSIFPIFAGCFLLFLPSVSYSQTTAYFPNFGDDTVKRVLTSAENNFTQVDVCDQPYGAAVTPNGNNLVVTCENGDEVKIIATDDFVNTGAQTDISLAGDASPRGVAVDSRGQTAFVANYGNDTVSRININTGVAVGTPIEVGDGPWGVTAFYDSANARTIAYVTNHEEDSLSVIIDGTVEDTIAGVGDGPIGAALTPDGDTLYIANLDDDEVVVYDTSDPEQLTRISTISVGNGPWGVAMASGGDTVFVTNSLSDTVTVINTSDRTVSGTHSVGDKPLGIAAPINGDFAYAVNQTDNSISKVTTTGTVTTIGDGELNGAFSLGAFVGGSPPVKPTDLEATSNDTDITLTWTELPEGVVGVKIERRETGGDDVDFDQVDTLDGDETTYTDFGLARNTEYEYRIRVFNEVADSDYSGTASATTTGERFSWCFIGTLLRP